MTGRETILLCGAGRMGQALLDGWLAAGVVPGSIAIIEPAASPDLIALAHKTGMALNPANISEPPSALVLAVKPQVMDEAVPPLVHHCGADTVVISIAAGRTMASIARHLPPAAAIVRAMPNTPAAIGRGITAAVAGIHVKPHQRALSERLLRATGDFLWLDAEEQMDAVTAVSGSGPAYVFLLAECLAAAARNAGLPPATAERLARATVSGAGELLHRSQSGAAKLRADVTSPGGTTAAALAVLMREPGLAGLLDEAVAAAARRARELSA